MKKVLTLCIPLKDNKVLLGMKKRGFGMGRWNGFGGKVEEGETIAQAALRELSEEAGINDGQLTKAGVLEFSFENDKSIMEVHVFKLTDFSSEPTETNEMKPQWFSIEEIPFSEMWPDDAFWFPFLLSNKTFEGSFLFDRPSTPDYTSRIISKNLKEVSI